MDSTALLSALRLAGWLGVVMTVQDHDGRNYQLAPPIIIGRDYVQFAGAWGLEQIRVPFDDISAFALP